MEGLVGSPTRESFYSGLNGTTKAELNLVLPITSTSLLPFVLLQLQYPNATFQKRLWLRFVVELVMIILPVILAFTVLSDSIWMVLTPQLTTSVFLLLSSNQGLRDVKNDPRWQDVAVPSSRRFLTNFRVMVNVSTAVAILAVDFQIFPRRFAKTETYGIGLMDAGVGLFMMGNALVSPEARGKLSTQLRSISSSLRSILRVFVSCSPLLVLGFLRLLSVKSIDYHEHVSEYGVHWNFFFTLAAVRILITAVFTVVPVNMSAIVAAVLAFTYQYLLTMHGLEGYILHGSDGQGSRNGIIEANREGIYSCIGYSAIYLAGVSLGSFLFKQRSSVGDWARCLFQLILFNSAVFLISTAVPQIAEPVSRRLANLPYILWIVTCCINNLMAFLVIDLITALLCDGSKRSSPRHQENEPLVPFGPSRRRLNGPSEAQKLGPMRDFISGGPQSLIMDAVNKNQLLNFLLANLFTGAINLSVDTIQASSVVGFVILVAYTLALCLVEVLLYTRNVNTKVW